MPRYRITGDILTAFAETLDLPKGFDIEDESVREQIALAVGIRRYGREQDFNVCDVIEVDADGNEIVETGSDAEATAAPST
jgi:hypothetical protein